MTGIYKETNFGGILRLSDNTHIPTDPANKDFAEYLKWVDDGNVADPMDPPLIEVPSETLTPLEKLQAAGLTVDDLKTLLGLK